MQTELALNEPRNIFSHSKLKSEPDALEGIHGIVE